MSSQVLSPTRPLLFHPSLKPASEYLERAWLCVKGKSYCNSVSPDRVFEGRNTGDLVISVVAQVRRKMSKQDLLLAPISLNVLLCPLSPVCRLLVIVVKLCHSGHCLSFCANTGEGAVAFWDVVSVVLRHSVELPFVVAEKMQVSESGEGFQQ